MIKSEITLCVAGASGLVGSNIVRAALESGYTVNGTLRDRTAPDKGSYLKSLPGGDRLSLFSSNMEKGWSFNEPLKNADAVFIACLIPTYQGVNGMLAREMNTEQGYNEIIKPTVDGCKNILLASRRNGVRTVLICSSTSSTNPVPAVTKKNEIDHWSCEETQCAEKKYTSATKTIMEKMAIKFAAENNMRLVIIMPTGLYGPVILPEHMRHNPFVWLKRVIDGGNPRHQKVPNDSASMIHLHDLARMFLAAYQTPSASGRYFGVYDSLHWAEIYKECQKLLPNMKMPEPLEGIQVAPTGFDFSRRNTLGVDIRDFPTLLYETIEWIKSEPFKY